MDQDVNVIEPADINEEDLNPADVQDIAPEDVEEGVPAQTAAPPTPAATPQYASARELALMRQAMQELTATNERLRTELDEYEFAGMDADEAAQKKLARVQRELDDARAQQANQEWRNYVRNYVDPDDDDVFISQNPVDWVHAALEKQKVKLTAAQQKTAELMETVAALKRAKTKPDAPKVTTNTGVKTTGQKTVWEYPLAEIERLAEQARYGLLKPEDIPPLE